MSKEAKESTKSATLYVAFDVEAKGDRINDPVIEIGVAWGTSLSDMQKMSLCLDYKNVAFQERCFDEFWSKQTENLKRIEAEAIDPKKQLAKLMTTMEVFEENYAKIKLLSDNPAYDIAKIDYALFSVLQRFLGIRYDSKGNYRSISDPSEQMKGLSAAIQKSIQETVAKEAPHTHQAADDALGILATHFYVQRAKDNIERAYEIMTKPTVNYSLRSR